MNKHNQWLAQQLSGWVGDDIISAEQAQILRSRYPVKDTMSLGRLLITGVGAIMIGLGVILLFAYNWAEMDKYLKLAVIFGALIGSHVLATFFSQKNHLLSESLFALGTMLMGASIFLVGQIYHLDSHYPDAFLLWSVGALLLAWARPSLTQAFMAIILVLSWHAMEIFDFQFANHAVFVLILLGILPLVWRLHSPVLARFVSVALFITLGLSINTINEGLVGIILLMLSAAIICLDQIFLHRGDELQKNIASEMAKPAMLVLVFLLLLLTFSDQLAEIVKFKLDEPLTSSFFWITLLLSQSGFIWLAIRRQLNAMVALSELSVLSVLLPSVLVFYMDKETLQMLIDFISIAFNLILLFFSVWLMLDGARHGDRSRMVRGSLLFAILAMIRYTDLFDSLIARASVFLVVGVALFAIGHIYQRNKKEVS